MTLPSLEQFRVDLRPTNVAHLIFDAPNRSMNVFSNAAIHELGAFARWLAAADIKGVVVRSGKSSAFCAGADLGELGDAYAMIMAAAPDQRHDIAFKHFFPLSSAIRGLETAGKPVAAAIEGLALGGGCELALGAHFRVLADTPRAALGLPESLVGLLPGAGGTQRLPRLIGVEAALPILLDGARLAGREAKAAGLVHEITAPENTVGKAEEWVLRQTGAAQPWDGSPSAAPDPKWRDDIKRKREQVLTQTLGHEPAPLAILNCIEQGFALPINQALEAEMHIFADLIQRREPRNMIRTLFTAKQERDRANKARSVPEPVKRAAASIGAILTQSLARDPELAAALHRAGFRIAAPQKAEAVAATSEYWFESAPEDSQKAQIRALLNALTTSARDLKDTLSGEQERIADLILVEEYGFPAYLGGPFALAGDAKSD